MLFLTNSLGPSDTLRDNFTRHLRETFTLDFRMSERISYMGEMEGIITIEFHQLAGNTKTKTPPEKRMGAISGEHIFHWYLSKNNIKDTDLHNRSPRLLKGLNKCHKGLTTCCLRKDSGTVWFSVDMVDVLC